MCSFEIPYKHNIESIRFIMFNMLYNTSVNKQFTKNIVT